jgi:hypothetical protein
VQRLLRRAPAFATIAVALMVLVIAPSAGRGARRSTHNCEQIPGHGHRPCRFPAVKLTLRPRSIGRHTKIRVSFTSRVAVTPPFAYHMLYGGVRVQQRICLSEERDFQLPPKPIAAGQHVAAVLDPEDPDGPGTVWCRGTYRVQLRVEENPQPEGCDDFHEPCDTPGYSQLLGVRRFRIG